MRAKYLTILTGLVFLFSTLMNAQIELHGFMRNYSAFRTSSPYKALMMRNRCQLNGEIWKGDVYGYASLDFSHNPVLGSAATRQELRELYLDIYSSWVDFRIGKQQVVWGKADGYFINDIVNPLDLSFFLLQDFEDIRQATTMFNTKLHSGNHSLEFLLIPEFRPMLLAVEGDWVFPYPDTVTYALSSQMSYTLPVEYREDVLPQYALREAEIGLKLNTFLLGTDLSLIYLHIRERKPVMTKQLLMDSTGFIPKSISLTPTHPWVDFYGFNFARPLGPFVFRGEGGYYPSRYFDYIPENQSELMTSNFLTRRPFLQGMLAAEYQLTGDIDLGMQYIHERILDYAEYLIADEDNRLVSFLLRGRFRNETLLPYLLTLYNLDNESYLSRLLLDWKYADSFTITLGMDLLGGEQDAASGQFNFGQFAENDNVYLKLTYDF